MANHRSPKPALQVRLLPLLPVSGMERDCRPMTEVGAQRSCAGCRRSAGARWRYGLLPLLRFSGRRQESPPASLKAVGGSDHGFSERVEKGAPTQVWGRGAICELVG